MGSSSSSSSSTRKTTTNTVDDDRVGASGNAIAAGSGGSVTITDELPAEARKAIEDAFDTLSLAGERSQETAGDVLDFAENITVTGLGLAGRAADTAGQSLSVVAERQKKSESGPQIEDFAPLVIGAASVIGFSLYLAR